ncbi:DUF2617 family protein [Streptomyces qinzhouensis]|uniref:DUF2617 family protein n=1 Tax=Streptomyces qinzhouensis TaxID=2599401 RepID=A0A5B8JDS9_9ACTN|nr:DUF2617 family protein [Streptomyces qinzhouensis]QDY79536.1 DUF2617 family protein [Streptomyces qinzhouensis]
MSARSLATPYQDTDADQLSFALGHPPMAALAVRDIDLGGLAVQLRLLGASHQVFAGPVAETVACLPGGAGGLPDTVREIDGWQYRFRAQVHRYPPEEFSRRVARIVHRADTHPHALYGVFPGDPEAVTALTVDTGTGPGDDGDDAPAGPGLNWRTWHTYPQSRRIVATHSRLEAR